MDTMEITKYVGAFCGSLLVFLLISTASGSIFDTHSDVVAFSIPVEDAEAVVEEETGTPVDIEALLVSADAAAGEGIFRRCAACHKVDGTDGIGPHLNGVIGRDKGSIEGFGYSEAMAGAEGAWDPSEMFAFLENPKQYVVGTSMAFAGLAKPEERANVIAYLASLDQ